MEPDKAPISSVKEIRDQREAGNSILARLLEEHRHGKDKPSFDKAVLNVKATCEALRDYDLGRYPSHSSWLPWTTDNNIL